MRIALCIPVYKAHLQYLYDLLSRIEDQTRKPDLVVVSASSIDTPEATELLDALLATPRSYPLEILRSSCRLAAGANRNRAAAASLQAGVDLISFIDADDYMHPQRLEILEQAFHTHQDTDCILHQTQHITDRHFKAWQPIQVDEAAAGLMEGAEELKREAVYSPWLNATVQLARAFFRMPNGEEGGAVYGHATVRAGIFQSVQFDELQTGLEDVAFIAQLMLKGYGVSRQSEVLSAYYSAPSDQKREEKDATF